MKNLLLYFWIFVLFAAVTFFVFCFNKSNNKDLLIQENQLLREIQNKQTETIDLQKEIISEQEQIIKILKENQNKSNWGIKV